MAAQLWKSGTAAQWHATLQAYPLALKAAAGEKKRDAALLPKRDRFMTAELPGLMASRTPPHATRDDLLQLVDWKLTRGKWRPKLQEYARTQPDGAVEGATSRGLAALRPTCCMPLVSSSTGAGSGASKEREDPTPASLKAAIEAIAELKGVGPATASAVVAALCPGAPFMGDEALQAIGITSHAYKTKEYLQLAEALQGKARALGPLPLSTASEAAAGGGEGVWSAVLVERALWAAETLSRTGTPLPLPAANVASSSDGAAAAVGRSDKAAVAQQDMKLAKKPSSPTLAVSAKATGAGSRRARGAAASVDDDDGDDGDADGGEPGKAGGKRPRRSK